MIIKYVFADGTISEVEVDEEIGQLHLAAEREEQNYERKQRYHGHISLDKCDYEGKWFIDPNPTPLEQAIIDDEMEESEKKVKAFYSTLTEPQLRRTLMLEQGMTQRQIADIEGVNLNAVQKSIDQVRKKYKEFFKK